MSPVSLKLSEAIKLGAMLKPQGFHMGPRFNSGVWGENSCALQAATDAVSPADPYGVTCRERWPWIFETPATCPVCSIQHHAACGAIAVCLNDRHEWTREQIADWVATIEPAEVPDAAQGRESLPASLPVEVIA